MKKLQGYSKYNITEDGVIYDTILQRYVSTYLSSDGYVKCTLKSDSGKRKTFSVHRLVATLYIENPLDKLEVNHKDGVKINNSMSNLEWCTHSENIKHAWDIGLLENTKQRISKIREKCANYGTANGRSKSVICITTGEIFDLIKDAVTKYNVDQGSITRCCQGKRRHAGRHPETNEKLKWRYYEH